MHAIGNLDIRVRSMAMKRCVGNLVANAQRHADNVEISAATGLANSCHDNHR